MFNRFSNYFYTMAITSYRYPINFGFFFMSLNMKKKNKIK